MDLRKHLLEALTLIAAAVLCAVVANAVASRERKIVLVGTYPNAMKVPPPAAPPAVETAPTAPATATTVESTTTATAPAGTIVPVIPATSATTTAPTPTTSAPRPPVTAQTAATTTTQPPANATAPAKPDLSKYTPHPDKAYIEIAYKDVAALHAGGALFLDARRTSVYEQGHIAGARPFSVWESDAEDKVRALWDQRQDPKEQALPIVVYCSGGDCEDSHMLSQKLWGAQFNNVYVYKDGFPDWQSKGGAVHTGANP